MPQSRNNSQNLEDMLSGGYTIRRICNQEDMLTQIPKTICPYSAIPAHMRIPGTVAIQTAAPAHFQLFVSLAIAWQVVRQGQCRKVKTRVQIAVTQVQP